MPGLHGGDGGGQERGEQVDFFGPHVLEEVVHATRAGAFGGGIDEVAGPLLEGFLAAAAGVGVPMPTLWAWLVRRASSSSKSGTR